MSVIYMLICTEVSCKLWCPFTKYLCVYRPLYLYPHVLLIFLMVAFVTMTELLHTLLSQLCCTHTPVDSPPPFAPPPPSLFAEQAGCGCQRDPAGARACIHFRKAAPAQVLPAVQGSHLPSHRLLCHQGQVRLAGAPARNVSEQLCEGLGSNAVGSRWPGIKAGKCTMS